MKYTGAVQLTSVSHPYGGENSEFNGKFADVNVDGTYGCVGRFRIVDFPKSKRYTVVWFVDGRGKGNAKCPVVGRTIEVRELRIVLD